MPRPTHNEWANNWKRVIIEGKKKAHCLICNNVFVNTSADFMRTHRKNCQSEESNAETNRGHKNSLNNESSSIRNRNGNERFSTRDSTASSTSCNDNLRKSPSNNALINNREPNVSENRLQVCPTVDNNRERKHYKYNLALYFLLVRQDFDFTVLQTPEWLKFLEVIDKSYKPPMADEFLLTISKQAYNDYFENQQLNTSYLMGAIILHSETLFYAVSFLIKNEKYYYIHAQELIFDDTIVDSTEEFLKTSVRMIKVEYKANIKIAIVESNVIVANSLKWNEIIDAKLTEFDIQVYNSLNQTIDNLQENLDTINTDYNEYFTLLNDLKAKIDDKYFLSTAVHDILNLLQIHKESEWPAANVNDIEEEIARFLNPVALVSYFMDPRFKGKGLECFTKYHDLMWEVLSIWIPDSATGALALYKKNLEPFCRPLFMNFETKFTTSKFWKIAKSQSVDGIDCDLNSLADFALSFVQLPCHIRRVDLTKLKCIFNSQVHNNIYHTAVVGYAILNI